MRWEPSQNTPPPAVFLVWPHWHTRFSTAASVSLVHTDGAKSVPLAALAARWLPSHLWEGETGRLGDAGQGRRAAQRGV